MRRSVGEGFITEATGLTPTVFAKAIASLKRGAKRTRCGSSLDFIDNTVREVLQVLVIASAVVGEIEVEGEPLIDRIILRTVETFHSSSELWRENLLPMTEVIHSCVHVIFREVLTLQRLEISVPEEGGYRLWLFPTDRWLVRHSQGLRVEVRRDQFGVIPLDESDLMRILLTPGIKRSIEFDRNAAGNW